MFGGWNLMKIKRHAWNLRASQRGAITTAFLLAGAVTTGALVARGQTYRVLYSFQCAPDGAYPGAGLAIDMSGNLYGTTEGGGAGGAGCSQCGTVFEVNTAGAETILHSFGGSPGDGGSP